MQDAKRTILNRVVLGEITPEVAAAELERLEASGPADAPTVASAAEPALPPAEPPAGDLRTVRVVNQMGSVVIVGDPTVKEVVAEGKHVARREGSTVVIEVDSQSGLGGGFRFGHAGFEIGNGRRLLVRMNPGLGLDVDVQAGSLKVHNVSGPIRAKVQAGSTTIDDCGGPFDVSVSAGSFRAQSRITAGNSSVRCDAGSVKIHLLAGSSCHIKARTTMGRISLPNGHLGAGGLGDHGESTVGGGAGSIDIQSSMGSVLVSSDQ